MLSTRKSRSTKDGKNFIRLHTSNNLELEKMSQELQDLEQELKTEQARTRSIEEILKKNQEWQVKKELANKRCLLEIEQKVLGRTEGFSSQSLKRIEKIQDCHTEIHNKLGIVQYKTLQILMDQEKTLINEYKELFISEERKRREAKRDLDSRPSENREKMKRIQEYQKWKQDFVQLDKDVEKETEKNLTLKLDLAERCKEITSMRIMVDELKLERERLKEVFQTCRFSQKLPLLRVQSERGEVGVKNSKVLSIEALKVEIEKVKTENREQKLKLFKFQENRTEIKVLIKKTLQDFNELIEKKGGRSGGQCGELVEKSAVVARIYDKAFKVKAGVGSRVLSVVGPQVDDIESTMQQIQNLYETYEKGLKSKVL